MERGSKRVVNADVHSTEYQMEMVRKLRRTAVVASDAHYLLYEKRGGEPGTEYINQGGRQVPVILTPEYVSILKGIAFRAFLKLSDIKPEGLAIAQQVMLDVNPQRKAEKVELEFAL